MNTNVEVFYYTFSLFISSIFILVNVFTNETYVQQPPQNNEPLRVRIIRSHLNFKKINKNYFTNNEMCCICLTDFNDNINKDAVYMTKCHHFYHKKCIKDWICSGNNQSYKCPMCLGHM